MTKLTKLEADVLAACYRSEYGDGQTPCPWAWSVTEHSRIATSKQVPGVVSSLKKKGLVTTSGSGDESAIGVTDAGFEAAKAHGIVAMVMWTPSWNPKAEPREIAKLTPEYE